MKFRGSTLRRQLPSLPLLLLPLLLLPLLLLRRRRRRLLLLLLLLLLPLAAFLSYYSTRLRQLAVGRGYDPQGYPDRRPSGR